MERATLTDEGWSIPSANHHSRVLMTSSGRVAVAGTFVYLRVRSVNGGTNPRVYVCHGRHPGGATIAAVDAKSDKVIDKRSLPVACPDGIYLEVTGDPLSIECEVLWK